MKILTAFQRKVLAAVSQVPRGRVITYKILAGYIRCKSCQAVGQALRRNPYAPRIPCHRVIASDLSVGGFKGYRIGPAIKQKIKLLAKEGVCFQGGKLADRRWLCPLE